MARIIVVGSANLDHLVEVDAPPAAGETVIGRNAQIACGGKGANQAVAAARLGADVSFVGAVGGDDAGARLRQGLRDAAVDDSLVREIDAPTGIAIVAVTPNGTNSILVLPGANDRLDGPMVEAAGRLGGVGTVVVQLEVPDAAVSAAAALAAHAGARLVVPVRGSSSTSPRTGRRPRGFSRPPTRSSSTSRKRSR
jgi:ribokinase